jgi:hypothetical protein
MAPGQLYVHRVSLTKKKELVVDASTTLMYSNNFCYVFLQIPKMKVQGAKKDTFARLALTSRNMLVRTKPIGVLDE